MGLSARRSASQSLSDLIGPLSDNDDDSRKRLRDDDDNGDEPDSAPIADSLNFDAPRKKVKHRHSRIARPRDSMPGYRRNKGGGGRRGRSSGRGRFSGRGGIVNVGARHLDRGSTAAAYYGTGGAPTRGAAGEDNGEAAAVAALAASEVAALGGDVGALGSLAVPSCSGHKLPCKRVTAKRGANKGREFYACAHVRRFEQCDFFAWADEQCPVLAADDFGRYVADGEFIVPDAVTKKTDVDEVASELFGIEELHDGQRSAVQLLQDGKSVLSVLPTGGGKSLVYQLYAAMSKGVVLVVTPLVSLMRDQELRMPACLPCASLRAAQPFAVVEDIERRLREGALKVLLVSPERLFAPRFRALMKAAGNAFFAAVVVDEAHCISEWSHNFRTSYLRLSRAIFGDGDFAAFATPPPVLALTATATTATTKGICDALRIDSSAVVRSCTRRDNLTLGVSVVRANTADAKPHQLVRVLTTHPYAGVLRAGLDDEETSGPEKKSKTKLKDEGWGASARAIKRKSRPRRGRKSDAGSVLIYVSKQRECANVCNFLKSSNLSFGRVVSMYHAGMPSHERDKVQKEFQEGRISVLVATVAFGMGLNVANVRAVIHYDMPFSLESYAQEVGRAGRDGQAAVCHALVSAPDKQRLVSRAYSDGVEPANVRKFISALVTSKKKIASKNLDVDDAKDGEEEQSEEKHVMLHITHSVLESKLDMKAEGAETVVALLERAIEGVELLSSGHSRVIVQFFSHTPETLLSDEHTPALSASERRVVSAIASHARSKNGSYELDLAAAGMLEEEAARALRRLARSGCVKTEMREKALRVRCTQAAADTLAKCGASEAANAACILQRIERTRVRKARAVCAAFMKAEEALSAQMQSKQLHEALERYFEEDGDDCEEYGLVGAKVEAPLKRAISMVLGCRSCGRRVPKAPREVARILHGIQSAAFTAKAWYDCGQWGKWIHVEFSAVKTATADVIRSRHKRENAPR